MRLPYWDVAPDHSGHGACHRRERGLPIADATLFEHLCLEIHQTGLYWLTVLVRGQRVV